MPKKMQAHMPMKNNNKVKKLIIPMPMINVCGAMDSNLKFSSFRDNFSM